MKIKQRFTIYNVIMLLTPIILMGVISVCFLIIFVLKYPVEELQISRAALIDPHVFSQAVGDFFQKNPGAFQPIFLWLGLCLTVMILTTTLVTMRMSRSITKPIAELTKAAENIRMGDLDFEVLGSRYEEIDILCNEFDSMRKSLRDARKTEEQLRRERNMLLANLSHDLRTPVTSIKGYIDGIRDGVADSPEKLEKYLDTIYSKAVVIEDMVRNLSTFSKLELSKLQFRFVYGELNSFLREFVEEYRLDLEKHDMVLETAFCETPVQVKIDYEQMGRVFANLIENAIKYKKEGTGRLSVATYAGDGGIYAQIADDGIGMKKEELKKVFEGFYRVDTARTMNIKGSGLGLGIARQIVEKHGGKIWLQSAGEHMGTKAIIYLPAVRQGEIQQ